MTQLDKVMGQRFGKLAVYALDRRADKAVCMCDCGKVKTVSPYNLLRGATKSCGCLRSEVQRNETLEDVLAGCDVRGPDDCWPWMRCRGKKGYGSFSFRGVPMTASRAAYIAAKGDLPPGYLACHTCDNPPCCNPKHLFAGTHQDNYDDMARKGRRKAVGPKGFRRMYCRKAGHLLAETAIISKDGRRTCGACKKEAQRRWDLANKDKMNAYRRDWRRAKSSPKSSEHA